MRIVIKKTRAAILSKLNQDLVIDNIFDELKSKNY